VAAGGTKADPAVMERIRRSTEEAVRTDDRGLTRKRLELLMHDPANVTDELVALRHALYHQPDFVANLPNLLCEQDMATRQRNLLRPDRLGRITAPTLVVWGRQTRSVRCPRHVRWRKPSRARGWSCSTRVATGPSMSRRSATRAYPWSFWPAREAWRGPSCMSSSQCVFADPAAAGLTDG